MTGPRQALDQLDAAAERLVDRTEGGEVIPAYAFLNADAQDAQRLALALPTLTGALRAVLDLADELEADAQRQVDIYSADSDALPAVVGRSWVNAARQFRAAVSSLGVPDTGGEAP